MSLHEQNYKTMELSGSGIAEEIDSQKLLYKYQFAFLHMQKNFTALVKVLKRYMAGKVLKSYRLWKDRTLFPYTLVASHLHIIKTSISKIDVKFRFMTKLRRQKAFTLLMMASSFKEKFRILSEIAKKEKELNGKELKIMNNEVRSLRNSQTELESMTGVNTKSEISLKQKISVKVLIEKTKIENMEIEKQIKELDRKTVLLFQEMNLVLNMYETSQKAKAKKGRKKNSLVIRKGFLPVCT